MWIVTGGAGYIGAHVVRALLEDGKQVVAVDDLSTGLSERLPAEVDLEVVDVLDTEALTDVLSRTGAYGVVHLAAKKAAGESVEQPLFYHRQNMGGVISLLEAMAASDVKKIVYSSSAAVYGEPASDDALVETSPTVPTNPYGTTKLYGEKVVAEAAAALGISWAALRYFNVAGCGAPDLSDTSANNLIPLMLRAMAKDQPVKIFGDDYPTPDGTCVRDYIHVVDLAQAHVDACRLVGGELPALATNAAAEIAQAAASAVASLAAAATDPRAFVDRAREAARAATPASVAQAARDSVNNLAQMVTGDAAAQNALRLAMAEGGAGVIVNVGTGKGSSVRDVVESMSRAAGHPVDAVVTARRPGDPSTLRADASHAADVLGWRSHLTLDDMTASAYAGMPWLVERGYC